MQLQLKDYDFTADYNSVNGQEILNIRRLKKCKYFEEINCCEKVYCDDFDYNIYLASIEALMGSIFCVQGVNNIGVNMRRVLANYSQKINIKTPSIYWLNNDKAEKEKPFASASPKCQIFVDPSHFCDYKLREKGIEKYMRKNFKDEDISINATRKLNSVYTHIKLNYPYMPAFAIENIVHELTHINQFSYSKEMLEGREVDPFYELNHIYTYMRVCCICNNKNYVPQEVDALHYYFRIDELNARRNAMEELMALSKNNNLNEETKNSILALFRVNVFNEILRVGNANFQTDNNVLKVLKYTRDAFYETYKNIPYARQLILRFNELLTDKSIMNVIYSYDKKFINQINYARKAKVETPSNDLGAYGIELALNDTLNNNCEYGRTL